MRELSTDFLRAPAEEEESGRCGIVAVVGRANVGKSTLLNRLVEEKVSIVSPVPQTTRNIIRAILTEPRGQLVFLDTPGVHKAKYELNRLMNQMARGTTAGADAVLLVLDGSRPPLDEDEGWMRRLDRETPPLLFAINKSDLSDSHQSSYFDLWRSVVRERVADQAPAWLPLSATTGEGVDKVLQTLFETMPESPYLFSREMLSDFPRKLAIADLVREKFLDELHDEIPHALAVEVNSLDEAGGQWRIRMEVTVKRSGQKAIVIGRKGRLLKKVRARSEHELSQLYGLPVTLDLWVKVDPKWDRNHWVLKRLGYRQ